MQIGLLDLHGLEAFIAEVQGFAAESEAIVRNFPQIENLVAPADALDDGALVNDGPGGFRNEMRLDPMAERDAADSLQIVGFLRRDPEERQERPLRDRAEWREDKDDGGQVGGPGSVHAGVTEFVLQVPFLDQELVIVLGPGAEVHVAAASGPLGHVNDRLLLGGEREIQMVPKVFLPVGGLGKGLVQLTNNGGILKKSAAVFMA